MLAFRVVGFGVFGLGCRKKGTQPEKWGADILLARKQAPTQQEHKALNPKP